MISDAIVTKVHKRQRFESQPGPVAEAWLRWPGKWRYKFAKAITEQCDRGKRASQKGSRTLQIAFAKCLGQVLPLRFFTRHHTER